MPIGSERIWKSFFQNFFIKNLPIPNSQLPKTLPIGNDNCQYVCDVVANVTANCRVIAFILSPFANFSSVLIGCQLAKIAPVVVDNW